MTDTQVHPHYQHAHDYLQTGRGNNPTSSKLANNTYAKKRNGGIIAVVLHATDVITFYLDGKIKLDSGGWRTPTTKDRISTYLPRPLTVYQEKSIWYVRNRDTGEKVVFEDGMEISPEGNLPTQDDGKEEELLDLQKQIKSYAEKFADAFVKGDVKAPSGGDCWMCIGVLGGNDHLHQHMEEDYFVPRLLTNAIEKVPTSMWTKSVIGKVWQEEPDNMEEWWEKHAYLTKEHVHRDIKNIVRKYMKIELKLSN